MTDEEFIVERDRIGAKYLGACSNTLTEHAFRNEISDLVRRFYTEGGILVDVYNEPIATIEEVVVVINRTPHTISATAVRRANV